MLWLTQRSSLVSVCGPDALWALFGIGRALERGDRLQPHLIDAIEEWLEANKAI